MPHSYSNLLAHIVFATKDRRPLIDADLESRLFPYIGGIIRKLGGVSLAVNGSFEHVHILAEVPPVSSVADFVRNVKGSSSHWIHQERAFEWQRGYAAFSVSRSKFAVVKRYIERQKEHHRKAAFRDEWIELLRAHGISPDEKYVWT